MRVEEAITNPDDPRELSRVLVAVLQVLNRYLDFGDPMDPETMPAQPNGTPGNMFGSWVRIAIDAAAGAQVTFTHNLDVQATPVGTPNVYWPVCCFKHSGVGSAGLSPISLVYQGGAITRDSIQLVLQAPVRTVNGANPVTAVVFFAPTVGW